jgi:pimeloyl-ACP methyl ester carboxylesterase
VHAGLAKALDWGTIQLAGRWVKIGAESVPEPAVFEKHLRLPQVFCDSIENPVDWFLDAHGTFQFKSPVCTPSDQNNTVFGRLYPAAKEWTHHPTVLLLHGWNAELCYRRQFPYLAWRLRQAGFNAATIELPYHLQRRPRNGPVTDFISSDLARMIEATRQAVADIRTLGHWLIEQGSPCVGLWGFSLGAWLAGLMVCSEPHLPFAVLTTPIARLDRAIGELWFCEPVRRSLRNKGHGVDLRSLNLISRAPQIDPSRILLIEARHDLFVPADTIEELWQAWHQPAIWRLSHGHISVLLSIPIIERTVHWIRDKVVRQDPVSD